MDTALQYLTHYTYEDWLHWEGRWELIEGHPIAMNPAPMPRHQRAAGLIFMELELAIRAAKCKKCRVYEPIDYKIADDTILEPDVLVVCKPIKKKFLDFPPALVVEVYSPATVLRDRNKKFELYQQQGVLYYLMVDAEKGLFYLYQLVDEQYHLVEQDFNALFPFLFDDCKVPLRLNEVWKNI